MSKVEILLWSGLQWHRSCHSNKMTPLGTLLVAVFLGTGNFSSKIVYGGFFLQSFSNDCYDRCPLSLSKICESVSEIFWNGDFMVRNTIITGQSAWYSAVICRKRSTFQMRSHLMAVSIIFKTCVIIGIAFADCLKGWRIW